MPRMNKLSRYRTLIANHNGRLSVQYIGTEIVRADATSVTLNSDGWQTATTKRKMQQASIEFGLGYSIWQHKGEWFVRDSAGHVHDFYDGITLAR